MARKANPRLIGTFVLGAVALVVVALVVFGGGKFFTERQRYVLFFEGSVKGLSVGASVVFRGVRIGSVSRIEALIDGSDLTVQIPVYIEVLPERVRDINVPDSVLQDLVQVLPGTTPRLVEILVDQGLRAQLGLQSFVTGQKFVGLDFHPDTEARYANVDVGVPEIPTIPSAFEQLEASIEGIMQQLRDLPLKELIERVIQSGDKLDETLVAITQLARSVDAQIEPLASSLIETSEQAKETLAVAGQRLRLEQGEVLYNFNNTLTSAEEFITSLDQDLTESSDDVEALLANANGALSQAEKLLTTANQDFGPQSPIRFEVLTTLRELRLAATSIRILAEFLQRNPNALLTGKKAGGRQ